jgi:hypothetical protein
MKSQQGELNSPSTVVPAPALYILRNQPQNRDQKKHLNFILFLKHKETLNASSKRLQILACLQEEMIGNFSTKLVLSSVRYRNGLDSLVGTGTSPSQKANLHTKDKSSSTCMCTENEIYTKAQTPFLHVGISKNK